MKWAEGSVVESIQVAKNNKAVFIVYVSGSDDASQEMNEVWETTGDAFENPEEAITLKLEASSQTARQFSEIYPVMCLPSTFFIGLDGAPLDVLGGQKSTEELLACWFKVKEAHESKKAKVAAQATADSGDQASAQDKSEEKGAEASAPAPASAQASSSAKPPTQESAQASAAPNQQELSSAPAPASAQASSSAEPPAQESAQASAAPNQQELSQEEKKALVQAKLEEKRMARLAKEKEEELRKEKEQRELGKNVTKLKQWQKEQEQKEAMNEWKKDREEDKKYKEKIKAEIARDRAERAARFKKEKGEQEKKQTESKAQADKVQQEDQAKVDAIKRETARIQFRLPDGSSFNEQFASSETLGAARTVVKAKVSGKMSSNISLSMLYPKRTFSEEDMSRTLLDLELAPSAVILVTPSQSTSMRPSSDGDGGGILWMIVAPFLALWTFLCGFIFASAPSTAAQGAQAAQQGAQQQQAQASARDSSSSQNTSTRNRRPKSSYGQRTTIRRDDGNIGRLHTEFSDDDDNATWNGNSTQQM